jgi:hypothetical protein
VADETPENEDEKNEKELFSALGAELGDSSQNESWILLNETYRGLLAGGFSESEALTLLTNLMWKMMLEGGS